MPLLALPNELLSLIVSHLGARDLSALILTNHTLYVQLTPLLHDLGARESYPTATSTAAAATTATAHQHTALYWAAGHGYAGLVQQLLLRGASVADASARDNSTALHWAARSGDEATTRLLLQQRGEWLNAPDSKGEGPIFWAARAGHEAVVRLLVEGGAQLENLRGQLLLHEAITHGFPGIARVLLQRGADFQRSDQFGWVPLHCAARRGDVDTTRRLLEMGAAVGALHLGSGATALHWAAKGGSVVVIRLLLDSGADIEARDSRCAATALHWAAFCGNWAAAQCLLREEADVKATCSDGNTALHLALISNDGGHDAVVRVLLDHTEAPDVNSRNSAGDTPLRWPVHCGFHGSVERVLKAGADIFIPDHNGRTALDCAEERLDFDMIKILAKYGTKGWRQASSVNWKILRRVPRLMSEAFEQKRQEAPPRGVQGDGAVSRHSPHPPNLYIPRHGVEVPPGVEARSGEAGPAQ